MLFHQLISSVRTGRIKGNRYIFQARVVNQIKGAWEEDLSLTR